MAAASLVFLFGEISRALLLHFGPVWLPVFGSRLTSATAAAIVLVLWVGWAALASALFAPDRLGIARLADRRLRLGERLSTALEIDTATPRNATDALLGAALVEDAHARIRTLDPRAIAPPWQSGWVALAPLAVALALFVAPAGAMLPAIPATNAAAAPQTGGVEQEGAVRSLRPAAESPETAPGEAALGAGATSAANAPKPDLAAAPSRDDATQASGRLAGQVSDAHGSVTDPAPQDAAAAALSNQVVALQSPPARPNPAQGMRPPSQGENPPSGALSQQEPRRPEPNVNNPEQPGVSLKQAPASHAGSGYDEAFSTFQQPQPSSAGAQMTLTEQKQVEAAENAYSSGREAGDGTRPLGNGGDDGQLASLLAHDAGQLSLPPAMGSEGERLSVKLAPPTETGPAASYSADRSAAWTGSPDRAVARHQPHAWERDVMARYFRPDPDGQ